MQYKVVEFFILVWIFLYNQNIPILKALLTQLKGLLIYSREIRRFNTPARLFPCIAHRCTNRLRW